MPSDRPSKTEAQKQSMQMVNQTRSEIHQIVKEIEEEFGKDAISYREQDLSME